MNREHLLPETMIPDLLRVAPQVRPVLDRYGLRGCGGELGQMAFLAFGFKPLASPWLRNTMAHHATIARACHFIGVDTDAFLMRLNQERTEAAKLKISLPIVA